MLRPSSSISSSDHERRGAKSRGQLRQVIHFIIAWTIGALILIDMSVGFAFRPPLDQRRAPSSLQSYFDYGRSIEGKLRRELGSVAEQEAPIMEAGWLAKECDISTSETVGKLRFDIYGMSFSERIAEQLVRLDQGLASQSFDGP